MPASLTVNQVKTDLTTKADAYKDIMLDFTEAVMDFATSGVTVPDLLFTVSWIDPNWPYVAMQDLLAQAPNADLQLPDPDSAVPVMGDIGTIDVPVFGPAPVFNMVAPPINLPTPPSAALPSAPGAAPTLLTPSYPTEPVINLPTPPSISNIVIDPAPFVNVPLYDNVLPDDNLTDPNATFFYQEPTYNSVLLDALTAELLDNLMNGGYGIEPLDEQALWERAREREALATEAAIQQAASGAAARGFPLPPGALMALIEGAQQEALAKISSANRDIAIKRADMYVENRKFTIEQAREVESMLITMFGYMAERTLKAATFMAQFGIDIFNAKVSMFNAKMERYKAIASVYETQLRAALANLEAWKAKLDGQRVEADVQKMYVDIYRTQLEGVNTLVNVYRTQMEAAQIFSNVERSKIEAYKATVESYVSQVNAKVAEFGMYKAQTDGELAKVQLYSAQVDAYSKEVSAYGVEVSSKEAIVRAQTAAAQLPIEVFRAKLGAYAAELDTYRAEIAARVQEFEGELKLFGVKADMQTKAAQQVVGAAEANSRIFIEEARLRSSHMLGQANAITSYANLAAHSAASGMSQFGTMIGQMATAASGIAAEITTY